ncbi:MAG: hypothetical protein D8M58_21385 [Calditrichaeota bacterium]|nr:MAG: hypothetical protein DWQ03_00110 [Calditrichota bacterium]MBL1207967.1 hypothetical protein [Calditrichota bacterium]NOG47803.1 hypothetical protein [Calditrichota bacterium]
MKEDILEQIVDDYCRAIGYFTTANIKYRPSIDHPDYKSKKDSVHSDIDIMAFNPLKSQDDRTLVINCKSWQDGFRTEYELSNIINNKKISGRDAKLRFRELTIPKWASALRNKVEEITGSKKFTYILAVTKIVGNKETWEQNQDFLQTLGNPIKMISMREMFDYLSENMTTTPAGSDIGRLIQVLKASGSI